MSVLTRAKGDHPATERRTKGTDDEVVTRNAVSREHGYGDQPMDARPWRKGDALRLWVLVGVGLIILVVSWAFSAHTTKFSHQLTCVAFAVLGIVIAIFGGITWLRRALAVVGKERRCLRHEVAAIYGTTIAPDRPSSLVFGEGMRRYHRADCDVVGGKPVGAIDPAAAREAGLSRCGMCGS
jgi:hypothetical protein